MSIGKNIKHDSSHGHVTGESEFVDDRSYLKNEVFVGVVGSPVAKGILKEINSQKALAEEGVLAVYTANDFETNIWGTIVQEQPLLVEKHIKHMCEPLCIIACESDTIFEKVKNLIEFDIEEQTPVLDIDTAIKNKDFCYSANPFKRGDVDAALKSAPHVLKGHFECGGQEHFYLESQASIVYPLDNGLYEVHSSSQHPTETQHLVAHAIGVGNHQVSCIVKRMGGAFGGKESQAAPFAAYAALVAKNLRRPARVVLTKDEDMKMTGKRHPFKNFYEVGFDDEGNITALKTQIHSNAGCYTDLSPSILERAMFHVDGAYYLPNCLIEAHACRTNHISNTAFRGFGGPQGTMTIESIIEDIAQTLGKDAYEIRKLNCYGIEERNETPFYQKVENNMLPNLFNEILDYSDYKNRLAKVEKFNKANKGELRGLSCTAVKFGIAFTARFLNQGNALVHIHVDGTVQASTGATEMGQGVNTKIQQIIAHAFGIDADKVKMLSTSTERNANTSPTAASSGSDINGAAALKACDQLVDTIKNVAIRLFNGQEVMGVEEFELDDSFDTSHLELKDNNVIDTKTKKTLSFSEVVTAAFLNRISLSNYAHFKTEGLDFNANTGIGNAFNYFTNGIAVSEVSIDEFTGELKVLRSDILMDLGRSLNPGIDHGQVTGAFVQGMGWVTNEKLSYSDKGHLLTYSPTTYKIPNIQDTPREFNVKLIENNGNDRAVHKSKAVGEPPFVLGMSIWTAAKHALSFRAKSTKDLVKITSPATSEVLLMELSRLKYGEKANTEI